MKIKSFGKINLNLRVLDEVVNGLHKIESLIVPIDLYDVIEIKEIKNDKDIITFDSMNIPENNTVSKSLNISFTSSNIFSTPGPYITKSQLYDSNGEPTINGLFDPKMGYTEPRKRCKTCYKTLLFFKNNNHYQL